MREKITFYRGNDCVLIDSRIQIIERGYYSKPEGWFESREEALADFTEALRAAKAKEEEIHRELKALRQKLGFDLMYSMEGDTHGIHEAYQGICIKVNGYEFLSKLDD